jgi:hypothetical protein
MYLWCSLCNKANIEAKWNADKFRYGVCPACGCSAYRNAVSWDTIYEVNGYGPIPIHGQIYSLSPTLDI